MRRLAGPGDVTPGTRRRPGDRARAVPGRPVCWAGSLGHPMMRLKLHCDRCDSHGACDGRRGVI